MVEAPGTAGEFGVLPGHVAFLSTLDHGEVRFSTEAGRGLSRRAAVLPKSGTTRCFLLDTAEFGEEIDLARAHRARERAETGLKGLTFEQEEYEALQTALMRAITGSPPLRRPGVIV